MVAHELAWGNVQRGLRLVVAPEDAMPAASRTGTLEARIQEVLRVPYVDELWLALSRYPRYLERAWEELEPNLGTYAAEHAADLLRAHAVEDLPLVRRDQRLSLRVAGVSQAELEQIRAVNDTLHYALPKVLLAAVGLSAALAGESVGGGGARPRPLPRGLAPGSTPVEPAAAEALPDGVAWHLQEIAAVHRHPRAPLYFRALARWPAYLEVLWHDLRPYVGSEWYAERGEQLQRRAREEWAILPRRLTFGPDEVRALGYTLEQVDELRCILACYRARILPDVLLDVTLAKALLDGPASARRSRFSLLH